MDTMYRVIGIDPSLTLTAMIGLATDEDGEVGAPTRLCIKGAGNKGCNRLEFIRESVIKFIDKEMPDLVVIEGFAYNAKGASVFEMGGLGWLLRWTLWKMEQPFLIVPPSVLKSFATGTGNSAKEVMLREVFRKWKYEAIDNNDADAYGLARLGLEFMGPQVAWSKKAQELHAKCEVGL